MDAQDKMICVLRGDLYFKPKEWVQTHERMKTWISLGATQILASPVPWIIFRPFREPTLEDIYEVIIFFGWSGLCFLVAIYNGLRLFKYQSVENFVFSPTQD